MKFAFARGYYVTLAVAAAALVAWTFWRWTSGAPRFGLVQAVALMLVPLAVRGQLTVSKVSRDLPISITNPRLTFGWVPAPLFASDPSVVSTIFPFWSLLVLVSYAVYDRSESHGLYRGLLQTVSGGALIGSVYAASSQGFIAVASVGVAAYFCAFILLEYFRRVAAVTLGRAGRTKILGRRWGVAVFVVAGNLLGGLVYCHLFQWEANTWGNSLDWSTVALSSLAVLTLVSTSRLRRVEAGLDAITHASRTMPWPVSQVEGLLRGYIGRAIWPVGRIDLVREPEHKSNSITAPYSHGYIRLSRWFGPYNSFDEMFLGALARTAEISHEAARVTDELRH